MKVGIYPITSKNEYMVDAISRKLPDVEIDTVVVPKAYAKSVAIKTKTRIVYKVIDLPATVDTVIVLSFWQYKQLIEKMTCIIKMKKNLICCAEISEEDRAILYRLAREEGVKVSFYNNDGISEEIKRRSDMYTPQESIVIAVGNLTKGIRTTKTVIEMEELLTNYGYRVSVVATDPDLQIFGWDNLPITHFIEANLDSTIMKINRFLTFHETINKPNIIILQLPDEGLHRISLDYETCFGALTYLISQAVGIDYGLMLSPIIDADIASYRALSQIAEQRYGFTYDAIGVLPIVIDTNSPQGAENVDYCQVSGEELEEVINSIRNDAELEQYTDSIFVEGRGLWLSTVANDIINKLS